jgi:hypothetical protein
MPGPKNRVSGERTLQIRLSDDDYILFEQFADAERMPIATWARGVLLRHTRAHDAVVQLPPMGAKKASRK